mgnify:FL=1|jgi:hypothetical protein
MECLPIPKGVSESTTLSARFEYLQAVLFYRVPESRCSKLSELSDLTSAMVEDFQENFSSTISEPRSVVQALEVLETLVGILDPYSEKLLKKYYSGFPIEYLPIYRKAAWSRAFDNVRKSDKDYKKIYQTCIDYILLGADQSHPEIVGLPPAVFLKLCATPMLEISLASRLFLIWKEKRGL